MVKATLVRPLEIKAESFDFARTSSASSNGGVVVYIGQMSKNLIIIISLFLDLALEKTSVPGLDFFCY